MGIIEDLKKMREEFEKLDREFKTTITKREMSSLKDEIKEETEFERKRRTSYRF